MSYFKYIILSLLVCLAVPSQAEVKIALFSVVNIATGEIVAPWPMFPGEDRHHAVIEINNYWYQMKPPYGVTKSGQLSEIMFAYSDLKKGEHRRQVEVFINSELNIEDIDLSKYNGVSFDLFAPWSDKTTSHCTKFIAGIMGYDPLPTLGNESEINLSPDDLYDILTAEQWLKYTYQF